MKKIFGLLLTLSLAFVLFACGHEHTFSSDWSSDANNHWHAATCEHKDEVSDKAAHTFGQWVVTKEATTEADGQKEKTCSVCGYKVTEKIDKLPDTEPQPEPLKSPMSYEEFVAAEINDEVCIEAWVQDFESFYNGTQTFYLADEDGWYFAYSLTLSEELSREIHVGSKLHIEGQKLEYSGQVEIGNSTRVELITNSIEKEFAAEDFTEVLTDELAALMCGERIAVTAKLVPSVYDGQEYAYLLNYNNSGKLNNTDLYLTFEINGEKFTWNVRRYLRGADTDVYQAVAALGLADVDAYYDVEAYVYMYNGKCQARIISFELSEIQPEPDPSKDLVDNITAFLESLKGKFANLSIENLDKLISNAPKKILAEAGFDEEGQFFYGHNVVFKDFANYLRAHELFEVVNLNGEDATYFGSDVVDAILGYLNTDTVEGLAQLVVPFVYGVINGDIDLNEVISQFLPAIEDDEEEPLSPADLVDELLKALLKNENIAAFINGAEFDQVFAELLPYVQKICDLAGTATHVEILESLIEAGVVSVVFEKLDTLMNMIAAFDFDSLMAKLSQAMTALKALLFTTATDEDGYQVLSLNKDALKGMLDTLAATEKADEINIVEFVLESFVGVGSYEKFLDALDKLSMNVEEIEAMLPTLASLAQYKEVIDKLTCQFKTKEVENRIYFDFEVSYLETFLFKASSDGEMDHLEIAYKDQFQFKLEGNETTTHLQIVNGGKMLVDASLILSDDETSLVATFNGTTEISLVVKTNEIKFDFATEEFTYSVSFELTDNGFELLIKPDSSVFRIYMDENSFGEQILCYEGHEFDEPLDSFKVTFGNGQISALLNAIGINTRDGQYVSHDVTKVFEATLAKTEDEDGYPVYGLDLYVLRHSMDKVIDGEGHVDVVENNKVIEGRLEAGYKYVSEEDSKSLNAYFKAGPKKNGEVQYVALATLEALQDDDNTALVIKTGSKEADLQDAFVFRAIDDEEHLVSLSLKVGPDFDLEYEDETGLVIKTRESVLKANNVDGVFTMNVTGDHSDINEMFKDFEEFKLVVDTNNGLYITLVNGSIDELKEEPQPEPQPEPQEDGETGPLDDGETGPLDDGETGPLDDGETGPLEDGETGPLNEVGQIRVSKTEIELSFSKGEKSYVFAIDKSSTWNLYDSEMKELEFGKSKNAGNIEITPTADGVICKVVVDAEIVFNYRLAVNEVENSFVCELFQIAEDGTETSVLKVTVGLANESIGDYSAITPELREEYMRENTGPLADDSIDQE